jgi:hypothetical protein
MCAAYSAVLGMDILSGSVGSEKIDGATGLQKQPLSFSAKISHES